MNTAQQVAIVKRIVKIKKRILNSSEWDHISGLIQEAVDASEKIPANAGLDTIDKTKSKEWNLIALRRMIQGIRERRFESVSAVQSEVSAALLRLSMVFVQGDMEDVNQILADSFLNPKSSSAKTNYANGYENDN